MFNGGINFEWAQNLNYKKINKYFKYLNSLIKYILKNTNKQLEEKMMYNFPNIKNSVNNNV